MGSSSQESGTSTRTQRSRPFDDLDSTTDDDSFSSSTFTYRPRCLPHSGIRPSTRKAAENDSDRVISTTTPTPMDTRVYDFMENVLKRTQEPELSPYAKRINDFTKVLGSMMLEIPENCFAAYMQESVKCCNCSHMVVYVVIMFKVEKVVKPPLLSHQEILPSVSTSIVSTTPVSTSIVQ